MKESMIICGRCKVNNLKSEPIHNAISRRDNQTYICSDCGILESLEDNGRLPPWTGTPYWKLESATRDTDKKPDA